MPQIVAEPLTYAQPFLFEMLYRPAQTWSYMTSQMQGLQNLPGSISGFPALQSQTKSYTKDSGKAKRVNKNEYFLL